MRTIVAALLAATGMAEAAAQTPCGKPPTAGGTQFYMEVAAPAPRDTALVARLCLVAGARGLGSYMATVSYDSSTMRVSRVETPGGMQVANARVRGRIRIAGASPNGFANGPLAVLTFSRGTAATLGPLQLTVDEASAPSGASLANETRATGWPAAPLAAKPVIDSITPRTGEISAERVTDLVVHGRGFAPSGNTVIFAGVEVHGLLSDRNGTLIRFAAPVSAPARGSTPGRRIEPGRVEVRVRHGGGTSNAAVFLVRDDG